MKYQKLDDVKPQNSKEEEFSTTQPDRQNFDSSDNSELNDQPWYWDNSSENDISNSNKNEGDNSKYDSEPDSDTYTCNTVITRPQITDPTK